MHFQLNMKLLCLSFVSLTIICFINLSSLSVTAKVTDETSSNSDSTNRLLTSDSPVFLTVKSSLQIPSTFKFPQDHCPIFFTLGILNEFNRQRIEEHYPPLALSQKTSESAQAWVSSNHGADLSNKPSFAQYGQLTWYFYSLPRLEEKEIGFWEPFETNNIGNKFWGKKGARPQYTAGDTRSFTEKEWLNTKDIGVGCSAFSYSGGDVVIYIAVFFNTFTHVKDEPTSLLEPSEQMFKFSVSQSFCPAGITSLIFEQINNQRVKAGFPALVWSAEIEDEANNLATKKARDGQKLKISLGYLTWARWWDSINKQSLDISVKDIFDEKWGSQVIPQKIGLETRDYTDIEWKQTEKMGIGCSVYRKSHFKPGVKFQVVALFK